MGQLRSEPKTSSIVTPENYKSLLATLLEAQLMSNDNFVYWDLGPGEQAAVVRREFLHVANAEGISLTVRRKRNAACLILKFSEVKAIAGRTRMTAHESNRRITACLRDAGNPLKKGEIIEVTGVSASTWSLRIRDLMANKTVERVGDRGVAMYRLV